MMGVDEIERRLQAAGESTRLRLLRLCADRSWSVGELARALDQSEPRVSRHLKILEEAGLVVRERRGRRVLLRNVGEGRVAAWLHVLLGELDDRDALLVRDAARARRLQSATQDDAADLVAESRLGRALESLLGTEAGGARVAAAMLVGTRHPELLRAVVRAADSATAFARSAREASAVRAFAERGGLDCDVRVLPVGTSMPRVDLLVLDRSAALESSLRGGLAQSLVQARDWLRPGGRLWLLESYDALEHAGERIVDHPLSRLRSALAAAGFACDRLRPVEADGQHVIVASARWTNAAVSAA